MPIRDYIKNANLKFNGKLVMRVATNGIVLHHAAASQATPQQIHQWYPLRSIFSLNLATSKTG